MVGEGVRITRSRVKDGGMSGHWVGGDGIAKESDVADGDGIEGGAAG